MMLYVFYAFSGPGGPMQYSKRLGVCVCAYVRVQMCVDLNYIILP